MQDNKTLDFLRKLKECGGWNKNYDYTKVVYISREDFVTVIDEVGFEHLINSRGLIKGVICSIKTVMNKNLYFIHIANKIHNFKYDYSVLEYNGSKNKIKIICKQHGQFEQSASDHLCGNGCHECGRIKTNSARLSSTSEFIENANKIHKGKYNYSLVDYKRAKNKVKIVCPKHGVFEQNPTNHLSGQGCKICGGRNQLTTKDFIKIAKSKHVDKYDYSLVKYENIKTVIDIICPIHGIFKQTPDNHLNSDFGCIKCSSKYSPTTNEFIVKAKEVHGNKYDYSNVIYKSNSTPVIIVDDIGFEHLVVPHVHLRGSDLSIRSVIDKTNYFIKKAKEVHGDRYEYNLIKYNKSTTKIKIIIKCRYHGEFNQNPSNHLSGQGCSICNSSKGESKIRQYLDTNDIKYEEQKKFDDCKSKRHLPFDFYLNDYNLLIEFNGRQHYDNIEYFKNSLVDVQTRDKIKLKFTKKYHFNYLIIKYDKIDNISKIITRKIKQIIKSKNK